MPFEPGLVDEPAGRVAVGIAEDAAGRRQPERLVGLSPAADVVEALLDDLGIGRRQAEGRVDDDVPPRIAAGLEPALAIAEPEVGRADDRLRPVGGEDARRLEDARDVGLVRAGVRPDGPTDRARDGQPELEPGQPVALGLGRGARHLDAGLGRVALAVRRETLGAGPG